MKKHKENSRYRVVSIRISDDQRRALEKRSRMTNRTISDLMREALVNILFAAGCHTSYSTGEKTL